YFLSGGDGHMGAQRGKPGRGNNGDHIRPRQRGWLFSRARSHADVLRSADREDQPGDSLARAPSHVGAQDAIGAILMLPNGVLSTVPVPAAFQPPRDRTKERLTD